MNDYFTFFYVKHFELPMCMKCAIQINLPCLALPCLALPCLALDGGRVTPAGLKAVLDFSYSGEVARGESDKVLEACRCLGAERLAMLWSVGEKRGKET